MPSTDIIGLDIGGTKCAVSRFDRATGAVEETRRFATGTLGETLEAFYEAIGELRPREPLFGVSCGGPLDARAGLILSPPNLPGWDRVPITRLLTERFGGRAVLMNDANASALAEWRFGAGRGCRHMIFLTAGTGMGAGLILNGRLYEGASGDAGEAGHMRLAPDGPEGYGKAGSFEGFCSGGGIARLAARTLAERGLARPSWFAADGTTTAKAVAEAARAGDAFARGVMDVAGRRLGEALSTLIDLFNPERVVIGGIFPRCGDLLLPEMERALRAETLVPSLAACEIVAAQLGETIGSHAAVAAALNAEAINNW
ncbi:MAG: ROK family protein [Opitutaceae bacterium]|jgi:glucokinase|nr:ROK family protein [Opitutaceae bacterium]